MADLIDICFERGYTFVDQNSLFSAWRREVTSPDMDSNELCSRIDLGSSAFLCIIYASNIRVRIRNGVS